MSAGVCGKRLGFEEIFGSSSSPSNKRSRRYSPVRDFGFGSEDKVSILLRMFPSMDRELVESVLNTHNHKIEDAIESLNALCIGDVASRTELQSPDSMMMANSPSVQDAESTQEAEEKIEELQEKDAAAESRNPMDGASWVDIFLQEMKSASGIDDARVRAARILEAFEKSVNDSARASHEQEIAVMKEHLQNMLRDNTILKRAVAIQHERNLEHEVKVREVEQLKHVIGQYHEQIKTLEMNNYTLQVHLQRAQGSSSIPGNFHPDIF